MEPRKKILINIKNKKLRYREHGKVKIKFPTWMNWIVCHGQLSTNYSLAWTTVDQVGFGLLHVHYSYFFKI